MPKKISEKVEEMLIEYASQNPCLAVDQLLENTGVEASKNTGWRALKDNGFQYRTVDIKWKISPKDRERRLQWAKESINFAEDFWKRVVFSDESRIQYNTKKKKLWLSKESAPDPIERDRWQVSISLWGAIKYSKTSMLQIIDETLRADQFVEFLKKMLLKNLSELLGSAPLDVEPDSLIFQQDKCSVHTSIDAKGYFEDRDIYMLPWPPKSPDLNLIEAVWASLQRNLKSSYEDKQELIKDVERIWKSIPSDFIISLYNSMTNRIEAVIDAEGGPTHY